MSRLICILNIINGYTLASSEDQEKMSLKDDISSWSALFAVIKTIVSDLTK